MVIQRVNIPIGCILNTPLTSRPIAAYAVVTIMAQNTVEKRPRKLWSPPSAPSRVHEFIAYVNALHGLTISSVI